MFEKNDSGRDSFTDAEVSNWLEESIARAPADTPVADANAGVSAGRTAGPASASDRHLTRDNAWELARELNELPPSAFQAIVVDDAHGLSEEFLRRLQAINPNVRIPDQAVVCVAVAPAPHPRFAQLVSVSLALAIVCAVWGITFGLAFGGYAI